MLGSLGASTQGELESMINGIDRIIPFLLAIPSGERGRSIIADDAQFGPGQLFSPEAFGSIRAGFRTFFVVDSTTVAIDGRKVRSFEPIWEKIVDALALTGAAKIKPVAEITARDINDSIDRLSEARDGLVGLLPERQSITKKRSSILGWLLVGAAAIYVKTKVA